MHINQIKKLENLIESINKKKIDTKKNVSTFSILRKKAPESDVVQLDLVKKFTSPVTVILLNFLSKILGLEIFFLKKSQLTHVRVKIYGLNFPFNLISNNIIFDAINPKLDKRLICTLFWTFSDQNHR